MQHRMMRDISISIHAPTRGATAKEIRYIYTHDAFQSTHPRGVRRLSMSGRVLARKFQSTHPRGVRLRATIRDLTATAYFNPRTHEGCDSRHSPHRRRHRRNFNPRTHEGCDKIEYGSYSGEKIFQSTHPRGVRLRAGTR